MMRRHLAAGLAGVFVAMSMGHWSEAGDANGRRYPKAPRSDTVDVYHGTEVADPYRPLEDPDSPETRAWVEAENKVTAAFLEGSRPATRSRSGSPQLWDYEKFGVPFREGGRTFYTRNSGLQNQGVLYTIASPGAEPEVLLDPNTLSADGTVALTGTSVSDDGALLAYGLAIGRLGLAGVAGPRRRDGPRPRRPAQVDQVLGRLVDQGRQGLLLQPIPRAQARRGPQGGQLLPEALSTTSSARPSRTTSSSTSGPTTRSGSSTASSPTTAST